MPSGVQLFFGVPVTMQEESFLSLAAISCFFADSDDEGARTQTKERRGRAFTADSDDSEDDELRLGRSGGKWNRQRDKLPHDDVNPSKISADQGGRKRSFSDVSANDHTAKGKASRRSTSGAPAPAEQKSKEKEKKREKKKADNSKRHKAGKVWALDNLPELPGLEYIKANLYKYSPSPSLSLGVVQPSTSTTGAGSPSWSELWGASAKSVACLARAGTYSRNALPSDLPPTFCTSAH